MRQAPDVHVKIIPVLSKQDLREFIKLPFTIQKENEKWVPPLLSEEYKFFDPKKNPSLRKADSVMYLAHAGDKPVGRIMGIINRFRNDRLNERNACFGYLECYDDPEVARSLLRSIEVWAIEMGMDKMIGPLGFNDQDQKGFIIEGFEYEPSTQSIHNQYYMPILLEKNGYSKEIDYVVYQIDLHNPTPVVYKRIVDRLRERGEFTLPDFTRKSELKRWLQPTMQLMNETFAELFGYDALTDEEIRLLGKKFLPGIDPRFVKIALKNDILAAFILAIPNLNYGFRKACGKLLPFGWYYLLRAPGMTRQMDLLVAGVRREYRGRGLDVYGMFRIIEEARRAGYTTVDSHHELETNFAVRQVMENWGGTVKKRFRVYRKQLSKSLSHDGS